MRTRSTRRFPGTAGGLAGFALAELLLALCCVAVVLVPFVLYLRQASLLQHEGAERGRSLAWAAYQRQVVGQGIDPGQSRHFQENHPLALGRELDGVSRQEVLPGRASSGRLVILQSRETALGTERKLGGAGLELRAAAPLEEVQVPERPAQVFTMQPPVISPAVGARLVVAQVRSGSLILTAASTEGGRVVLALSQPARQGEGLGRLEMPVSAQELASGLAGEAWVEYPGTEGRTEQSVLAEDGRRIWYVETSGEVSRHMPSERVSLKYLLELGAPILVLQGTVYEASATVPIDFRQVLAVREGRGSVRIQWPDTVRALFPVDTAWLKEFEVSFQGLPGETESLAALLFSVGALQAWSARSMLFAAGRLPAGCRAEAGTWTLERQVLALPQPERVSGSGQNGEPEQPGRFEFQTAELELVGRPGRLSARNGSVLGSGGSLSLDVLP